VEVVVLLKKTVVTPRYVAHIEDIPPDGKTMADVQEAIDYAISEQLLKRIIAEQKQ
jgi:hypothetical protein